MSVLLPDINISDFDYPLPQEKIAQYPKERRDESKLLIWQQGSISTSVFGKLGNALPDGCHLVFNNTRVIHARIIFSKKTGATIEVFCLEPISPQIDLQQAFESTACSTWKCMVGNVKRWKEGILEKKFLYNGTTYALHAKKVSSSEDGCFGIEFRWQPADLSFSNIIERAGLIPLPPYINRSSTDYDESRYQTIYARSEGSVAAPTAGLHFTNSLLEDLRRRNILFSEVTLHVGIGTFRPVSVDDIRLHKMHAEIISVTTETIRKLIEEAGRPVFPVGTTSVRTVESLYWAGVKIVTHGGSQHPEVLQWDPYNPSYNKGISTDTALNALLGYLESNKLDRFEGTTSLLIIPGYKFRVVSGMITNFHMPQSTLLLLVAAFIGDEWKRVYKFALQNEFRFLSYGDACLFFRNE